MGNAAVIINHPTSLDHGQPVLDGGVVAAEDPGMIRLERSSGTPAGCGGTITFKRNVKACKSSNTLGTEDSTTLSAGVSASASVGGPSVGASAGIEVKEVVTRQDSTDINYIVSDKNEMSELQCFVEYVGKKGTYKWLSNDLNLKAKYRWSNNSEMYIKITFKEDADSGADSGYMELDE